jgi:hypothetical protein
MRDYSREAEERLGQRLLICCVALLAIPLVIAIGYLLHVGWRLAS